MEPFIIVFFICLIGIIIMIQRGVARVRRLGDIGETHIKGSLAHRIGHAAGRLQIILLYILHAIAVSVSRVWARISYRILVARRKMISRIDHYFHHKHRQSIGGNAKAQSILLATIKAYKREIRKLNQKIGPDPLRVASEKKEGLTLEGKEIK